MIGIELALGLTSLEDKPEAKIPRKLKDGVAFPVPGRHSMVLAKVGICTVTLAAFVAAAIADDQPKPTKTAKPVDPIASELLAAHNAERKKEGLEPLQLSEKLTRAALLHAKDMAEHHKLDHTGTDKSTVVERVKRQDYPYILVGENIAFGQKDVDEVMTTWMESPGHRANILAKFTEMGGALVKDDGDVNYWCVDFGTPIPQLKPTEATAALVKYLNDDRKEREQPLLKAEPRLAKAAMQISEVMAKKDTSKLEGDPFKLIETEAPRGREMRILLSGNAPTDVEAAKSLLGDDPSELDDYREIGVGYALAKTRHALLVHHPGQADSRKTKGGADPRATEQGQV